MTQTGLTSGHSDTASGRRLTPLLATLVLGTSCCATALAAKTPTTACDRTADLHSLEVPVSEWSTRVVGHIAVDPNQEDEPFESLPAQSDSVEPILDLMPRVADILDDVFSAVAIEARPGNSEEKTTSIDIGPTIHDDLPISPVVGDAGPSEVIESADGDSVIDGAEAVPNIQRQMFRKDI